MIAVPYPAIASTDPIRKLDLTRDLNPVADLIELCFPIHLDPDGKTYVDEMRKAAREMRLMGWLVGYSDLNTAKCSGFVWEEHGRIIGNLSLIPLKKDGRRVHMIANVAVHPDFRRRGIARKLTQRALSYLECDKESPIWLQVRDDNPSAIQLYRSLGFRDQAARTTWRIRPVDFIPAGVSQRGKSVRRRMREDWSIQRQWLEETYPPVVRWNLPLNFRRLEPDFLQNLSNFMDGQQHRHWTVTKNGQCQGVISWQKSESYANNLWLAFDSDKEADGLPLGLAYVVKRLSRKHPLSIDYPAGRCDQIFSNLGFEKFRTLIWMQCSLSNAQRRVSGIE